VGTLNFNKEELYILEDGLGWLMDQTNEHDNPKRWNDTLVLRRKILEELKNES